MYVIEILIKYVQIFQLLCMLCTTQWVPALMCDYSGKDSQIIPCRNKDKTENVKIKLRIDLSHQVEGASYVCALFEFKQESIS